MKNKNEKVVKEQNVVVKSKVNVIEEEKRVVKRKIKVVNVLILLIVLYVIGLYTYKLVVAPINNIYISNNNYLTDQEVIDMAGIRNYPSFMLTTKYYIKKNLLKNDIIENVKINKDIDRSITLEIKEATPLFIYKDKVILSNGKEINNNNYKLPIIISTIDNEIRKKLIDKYQGVNEEIKAMISEIEYVPNDIDKERFLFTMNDGNYVYITLYTLVANEKNEKETTINDYIKIISNENIKEKNGILYLDSGSFFETFDKNNN